MIHDYTPTGLLHERRAIRPLRDLTWPETRALMRGLRWRFPLFGTTFMRRPFDWYIDDELDFFDEPALPSSPAVVGPGRGAMVTFRAAA